jgi:hypothetical protein
MLRHYEYSHSIDNPLAAASTYHIEKLRREASQVRIADLACTVHPVRTWRLKAVLGSAWHQLWAHKPGKLIGAPRAEH